MIRTGIIGWGEHGKHFANALHHVIKDVELVGIAATSNDVRTYCREHLGLKHIFSNYKQLLELHQIDLVCVCSPADMHADQIADILKSGSSVLVDNPLASSVEDCVKINKLASNHPSMKVHVAFPRRYDAQVRKIRQAILDGKLGELVSISISNFQPRKSESEIDNDESKGIFMDVTLEDIDLVRYLSGDEYDTLYACGNSSTMPPKKKKYDADSAVCVASLAKGTVVNHISSRISHKGYGYAIEIIGQDGSMSYNTLPHNDGIIWREANGVDRIDMGMEANVYLPILEEVIKAIRFGDRLSSILNDATMATKVGVAMTKSYVLGKEIEIDG